MPGYRGKRALDLLFVLLLAPVWVPLMGVIALAIRLINGPPVFFRQLRIGLHDQSFELIKFLTMRQLTDGEGELLPDQERLTSVGRFLRSTSLDETPEVLNVLRGEMSVVGPRPLLPQYLPRYSAWHRRRHEQRPGITGLAQALGRNNLSFPERFDLDIKYVDACSLRLDLWILLRTVWVVLRRSGVTVGDSITPAPFTGYDVPQEPRRPPAPRSQHDPAPLE